MRRARLVHVARARFPADRSLVDGAGAAAPAVCWVQANPTELTRTSTPASAPLPIALKSHVIVGPNGAAPLANVPLTMTPTCWGVLKWIQARTVWSLSL
jgi:hypothetical protein